MTALSAERECGSAGDAPESEPRPGRGRNESFITDNWAQKSLNKPFFFFLPHFAGTFYIVGAALYSPEMRFDLGK